MKKIFFIAAFLSSQFVCPIQGISQGFTDVSVASNLIHSHDFMMGGGVAFLDYDKDGDVDIYMSGGQNRDGLFQNDGFGQFSDVTSIAGLGVTSLENTTGVSVGDINNDGFDDLFVTSWNNDPSLLFLNNTDGTFSNISAFAGVDDTWWCLDASFGDVNLDGYLDLYVGNYVRQSGVIIDQGQVVGFSQRGFENFLYMNNGDNTFTKLTQPYGVADSGCALAVAFTDFDFDHDVDLHVANDFGEWWIPDGLYQNEYPNASFANVSASSNIDTAAMYGMGIAIGDYDEDGDLDYYTTNLGRNVLSRNNGDGTFTDVSTAAGVENTYSLGNFSTSWGCAFVDYDNYALLDLFVANGWISAAPFIATGDPDSDKLFRNNGNGTFTDVSVLENVDDSTCARGMAFGDYDQDGDIDLLVSSSNYGVYGDSAQVKLHRNNLSNGNNWLAVNLNGLSVNRNAYGSRVRIVAGGRNFIREIDGGSSQASRSWPDAHFGLGAINMVDTIEISWIGGKRQYLYNQGINQRLVIWEDTTTNACPEVLGLWTDPVTTNSARLNWTNSKYCHWFQIRGRQLGGGSWLVISISEASLTHKDVFGLNNNTSYEWQIRQYCDVTGAWISEWSGVDTFTTGCFAPDTSWSDPVSSTEVQLNWIMVEGAAGYEIRGKRVGSSHWTNIPVGNLQNSKTVFGLTPTITYEWTIRTLCDSSGVTYSAWRPLVNFTTNSGARLSRKRETGVMVIPNPFEDHITISSSSFESGRVKIWNSAGQLVESEQLSTFNSEPGIYRVSTQTWPSGIYFVEVESEGHIHQQKILKR